MDRDAFIACYISQVLILLCGPLSSSMMLRLITAALSAFSSGLIGLL